MESQVFLPFFPSFSSSYRIHPCFPLSVYVDECLEQEGREKANGSSRPVNHHMPAVAFSLFPLIAWSYHPPPIGSLLFIVSFFILEPMG